MTLADVLAFLNRLTTLTGDPQVRLSFKKNSDHIFITAIYRRGAHVYHVDRVVAQSEATGSIVDLLGFEFELLAAEVTNDGHRQ